MGSFAYRWRKVERADIIFSVKINVRLIILYIILAIIAGNFVYLIYSFTGHIIDLGAP